MGRPKKTAVNYTIEREFLGQITATELINNIIRSHSKDSFLSQPHSLSPIRRTRATLADQAATADQIPINITRPEGRHKEV